MRPATGIHVIQTQRLSLNAGLHAALRILRADAEGLSRYLEEQAAETPALLVGPPEPALGEWLPRWSGLGFGGTGDPGPTLADQGPSLMAHVVDVLPRLVPEPKHRPIAIALAEALEPTGWLGRPIGDIAREVGAPPTLVETVLGQLQRIEPAGLFARDLAECLRLQAGDAGVLDPVMTVLLDHLPLLAAGDWARLQRLAGADEAGLRRAFAILRGFNPKPGTAFSAVAAPLREPDLTVVRSGESWEVALNRSSLPSVGLRDGAEGLARAREVIRLVERRNTTLLAVTRAILMHQRAALDAGPGALRPLTMQAVADQLQIHKSTVSRLVAGTAVDTPLGTWWLRSLFSTDLGADTGAAALKARLTRLVAEEDRRKPLSDDMLAEALSAGGVAVARRTVAKYRSQLRIPPAHRRRQRE